MRESQTRAPLSRKLPLWRRPTQIRTSSSHWLRGCGNLMRPWFAQQADAAVDAIDHAARTGLRGVGSRISTPPFAALRVAVVLASSDQLFWAPQGARARTSE